MIGSMGTSAASIFLYIDPGTGSMAWQLLAAAGFGLLFYVRSFRRWVVGFFARSRTKNQRKE